ncbi:hypothetical protein JHN63_08010 [Streptomyces sp. MBT65]|uniref:hypothetical protein n=1 Tax=Streptomyces sp. MBT65 TaxID=1488395 RepID=UPI00190BE870|nr:hypothetical protein [Streptomyces sp. MBT65]MBK3573763.1 hypothetical protein [Streptomyces sp. MBT65]
MATPQSAGTTHDRAPATTGHGRPDRVGTADLDVPRASHALHANRTLPHHIGRLGLRALVV